MPARLAVILASLVIGQISDRARAAESSLAGAGDLSLLVGHGADIAPSAYFFRADGKPDDNPPETVFLFEGALQHARAGVICGLLWEEPRPVERIELTWPKDAQAVPPPTDVVLRWLPHGSSSSWWSRRGGAARTAEEPDVSADGRTYVYTVGAISPETAMDNLVVALRDGADLPARPYPAPQVRAITAEPWKFAEVEVEWGFQGGTEKLDFDGRLETYNGIAGTPQPLAGDIGTTVTRVSKENLPVAKLAQSFGGQPKVLATSATVGTNSSAARLPNGCSWQSKPAGGSRRGIRVPLLYLGTTLNTSVWTQQARLEDANRTIVTVRTQSGSFSFLPADLETGPILAPEYGFFVRLLERREATTTTVQQVSDVPQSIPEAEARLVMHRPRSLHVQRAHDARPTVRVEQ